MSSRVNVLLDLDGTLTDPRPGFVASVNHALTALGRDAVADDDIAAHIGPPLEETLTQLLGPEQEHLLGDAVRLYRERYSERGLYENSVYTGIPDALGRLRAGGCDLFLATSKPRIFAIRILDHFGLSGMFRAIHGSELDGTNADKRRLVAAILARERIEAPSAVMVGDRAQDVRAAQANGLASVGVLWGYGSRSELEGAGATVLVDAPGALPGALSSDLCRPGAPA